MKKLLTLFAVISAYAAVNAQAPIAATQDLNQRYSNVQASWQQHDNVWTASFQNNNLLNEAFYQQDGTWLGTETPSQLTQMSAPAQEFLNTRFIGQGSQYTYVKSVNRHEPAGDFQVAYLTMDSGRTLKLFFDASGNLARRDVSN